MATEAGEVVDQGEQERVGSGPADGAPEAGPAPRRPRPAEAAAAVRARARRRGDEPGLGPYTGPAVVLALLAAVLALGLLISLVGAVRAPRDVSNSATVLGTFPIDPDAPGIPAGPVGQPDATLPAEPPGAPAPDPAPTTAPPGPGAATGPATVEDPFDAPLQGWETSGGDWTVEGGDLVVPAGSASDPALALRAGDAAAGIGAEVAAAETEAGLVVAFADLDAYVAAVAVPDFGGWRLEVWRDGEVTADTPLASSEPGTQVQLAVTDGTARLLVDGVEAVSLPAPGEVGDRVGFLSRGAPGARWSALLAGPGA